MPSNVSQNNKYSQRQELNSVEAAQSEELDEIKCYLDLLLLAMKAIANLNSEATIEAAQDSNRQSVTDFVQRRPLLSGRGTVDEVNASPVLLRRGTVDHHTTPSRDRFSHSKELGLICSLASQHQELLRRGVSLLEQTAQDKSPYHTTLLGNYLKRFSDYYRTIISESQHTNLKPKSLKTKSATDVEYLSNLAGKLLIDLLFYSGKNGHQLLASAIDNSSEINIELIDA